MYLKLENEVPLCSPQEKEVFLFPPSATKNNSALCCRILYCVLHFHSFPYINLSLMYHNKILITRNAETLKVSCWLSSESGLLLENFSTAALRAGIIITLSWKNFHIRSHFLKGQFSTYIEYQSSH